MSTWTANFNGDVVFECVGNGGNGNYYGSGLGGGGGGSYARKKVTVTNGTQYAMVNVGAGNTALPLIKLNSGPFTEYCKADSFAISPERGGRAVNCIGDITRDGGDGKGLWGSPVENGGGGGGAATRLNVGANAPGSSIAGGITEPGVHGGNGTIHFSGVAADPGVGPGSGGGEKGRDGSTGTAPGQAGFCAIWAASDWNGDPTVDGTSPKAGTSPIASLGTFQPAPVNLKTTKRANFM